MTKDEAIKTLREDYCGNRIICELHPDQCNREECEIWLAIRALETQPDGDCISRRAFRSRIESEYRRWGDEYDAYQVLSDLDDFPSAQPKPDKNPPPEQPDSDRLGVKTGEPCTDTISRQAAIDCVTYDEEYTIECLKALPSAQPDLSEYSDNLWRNAYERGKAEAVRKGKWIGKNEMSLFSNPDSITYRCSECNHPIYTIYGIPKCSNYCPECGAKMEEGE